MNVASDEGARWGGVIPVVQTGLEFERFYMLSYRRALAVAVAVTGDRGHAEDIVQDVFSDAHRRWEALASYDDPHAWVRRAILNRAASRWTRLGREVRALARLARRTDPETTFGDADSTQFWACVAALPRRQAQVVVLFYVEDMSVAMIATTLDCSEGTVKTHLSRARAALHARLIAERELEADRE